MSPDKYYSIKKHKLAKEDKAYTFGIIVVMLLKINIKISLLTSFYIKR